MKNKETLTKTRLDIYNTEYFHLFLFEIQEANDLLIKLEQNEFC